jgi:DNA-binding response OmpR family regulator
MRILIADDERVIADSLALIFRAKEMEAIAVYSGESALELAESWHPDFVICDIVLGGMNGFEVATYIREHLPTCGIVLFSGHAATADLMFDAGEPGAQFDILTKPVHPRVLLDYVLAHAHSSTTR